MRRIDMESWPRREHFEFFKAWDYPHWNITANVEVTAFYPAVKRRGISFNVATVYVLTRAANTIPEFRQRIWTEGVVEHEIAHPATTILGTDDLFGFCVLDYTKDFSVFAAEAAERIAMVKECPTLTGDLRRDDFFYLTAIPWVSFTGFMHPIDLKSPDPVPRFAWGKVFEDGDLLKMPLSAQAHHALVDGLHAGRFYAQVQEYLDHPEQILGDP
jgi:chloramphenicol O-acetyltransferase type A